jgi:Tfp pilus assembly protein PilF
MASGLGLLSLCVTFACGAGSGTVVRMADGVRYEGRFVNPSAYAAYLLGVEREAHAEYSAALLAYLEAHAEDPDSPEIWARIGAVRCVSSTPSAGPGAARSAFQRGLQTDPEYFGNYLERARCAERAHAWGQALNDGRAAVAHRPDDEAANLLVARLLDALGRRAEAQDWLAGFRAYHGVSPRTGRIVGSARGPDSPIQHAAASAPSAPRSSAFAELGAGNPQAARKRAETELGADPTNSDAWIASLVACDALHDDECFEQALSRLKAPSLAPSSTALSYLRELLARRTGTADSF